MINKIKKNRNLNFSMKIRFFSYLLFVVIFFYRFEINSRRNRKRIHQNKYHQKCGKLFLCFFYCRYFEFKIETIQE